MFFIWQSAQDASSSHYTVRNNTGEIMYNIPSVDKKFDPFFSPLSVMPTSTA